MINELTKWVLAVDRRVLVMKTIHEHGLIKASSISEKTGRSLQNTSRALRELEKRGLIGCLTPEKHTWKSFVLTEKGLQVFESLKRYNLLD